MPLSPTHRLLLACALSAACWSHALAQTQAAPKAGRADPMNPQAEVPPVSHVSALAAYRATGDGRVGSWQEANQTVTRIGGWRAYAREAAAPASPPAPAAPGAAPAAAAPAAAASRSPAPHHGPGQP